MRGLFAQAAGGAWGCGRGKHGYVCTAPSHCLHGTVPLSAWHRPTALFAKLAFYGAQELIRRRRAFLTAMAELLRRRRAIQAGMQARPRASPAVPPAFGCFHSQTLGKQGQAGVFADGLCVPMCLPLHTRALAEQAPRAVVRQWTKGGGQPCSAGLTPPEQG